MKIEGGLSNSQQSKLSARIKNKIRGAHAVLNSKKPASVKGEELNSLRRANTTITESLALARRLLSKTELEDFERWAASLSLRFSGQVRLGTSETLLGLMPNQVGKKTLLEALKFAKFQFEQFGLEIEEFSDSVATLENYIRLKNFELAIEGVDQIIEKHGHSFWAVETKIACLNSLGKQNLAKEIIAKLSIGAVGLNTFYFYHFGVRNEASQSTSRFHALINRRLKDSDLSDEYKAYAAYRVGGIVPTEKLALAQVLSYEQYTTLIDLYFTAIRISVHILGAADNFDSSENIVAASILEHSASFNNQKIQDAHGCLMLPTHLDQDVMGAVHVALRLDRASTDTTIFLTGLGAMLSFSGSEADEEYLKKHILNYWWTSDAMYFGSVVSIPRLPELFSNYLKSVKPSRHPLIKSILIHFEAAKLTAKLDSGTRLVYEAATLSPWKKLDLPDGIIDCLVVQSCWNKFEDDDYQNSFRLIQYALMHNSRLLPVLPLRQFFKGVDFQRLRSYGVTVNLCNCLHWYIQIDNERQNRTFKRFAIEEWIEESGESSILDAVSKLKTNERNPNIIETFLSATCDIATIELLLEVDGTREALSIRRDLLKSAGALGTERAMQYATEADEIREQLEVDEVLDNVDETMVYVDEDAIIPILGRELAGDFQRYKLFLNREGTSRSSIDELITNLRQQSATAFQIPKSEAADLLLQMIQTVLDRFIDDPVYGLDSIIGRRIRHGTISSELRGALEQLHLIGQRPRSGADYDLPGALLGKIKTYDPSIRRGVSRAFSRFSSAIDSLIAQLRDEVFQCKPKAKLQPAFELILSPIMFAFASDAVNESKSAEAFSRELFSTFWLVLSTTVERERIDTKDFIERCLLDCFSRLNHDLKAAQITDVNFLVSIQGASEELQRRAEVIANWIRIPKVAYQGRTYPLALVFDAAMAFTKAKKAAFDPISEQVINEEIVLDGHGYPIVFDALCIGLSNIAEHSGIKKGNKVFTEIALVENNGLLRFTITNELGKDVCTKEWSSRIDSIRDDIQRHVHGDRARRTSGSGIAKLATIIQRYSGCTINFGSIEGNQKFQLQFEIGVAHHASSTQDQVVIDTDSS